jgi:hypothetical protein
MRAPSAIAWAEWLTTDRIRTIRDLLGLRRQELALDELSRSVSRLTGMGQAPSPVALRPRVTPGLPFRSSSDCSDGCDASNLTERLWQEVPAFGYCGPDPLVGVVAAQRGLAMGDARAARMDSGPFGAKACCGREGKPCMVSNLRAGASSLHRQTRGNGD